MSPVRIRDLERDVLPDPLSLVLWEAEVVVENTPDDLLAGKEIFGRQSANVDVFVAIRELVVAFVGAIFNFL